MRQFAQQQRVLWHDKIVRAVERGVHQAVAVRLDEQERRAQSRHAELLEAMQAWERRSRRDLFTAMDLEAARSSARWLLAEVTSRTFFFIAHDTLRHAVRQAPADGLVLEFGVATGTTLRIIAEERPDGPVYGFDSFEGLPEHWRFGFAAGEFSEHGVPDVPGARLVTGWFKDTLPDFLAAHADPVAFVHVDCDLYSSTKTVLEQLGPRFVVGTVLIFDEFYNHPDWQDHEYRAWQEYVAASRLTFEYVAVTVDDEQVAVRITGLPAAPAGSVSASAPAQ